MLRTLLAGLSGLVAAVLLPLSMVSIWTGAVVGDTDRYVEMVTPLADDDVVKAAATAELERQALRLVEAARPGLGTGPTVRQVIGLAVRNAVNGPAFPAAWEEANRAAHEQVVAALQDRGREALVVDLGAVLDTVVGSLAAQGLVDPGRVPAVRASVTIMDADQLDRVRRGYDGLNRMGFWLPVAWTVLVILTLGLARRRLRATAWLALLSLLTLALLALGMVSARSEIPEHLRDPEVARAVWDVLVRSLWRAVAMIAAVLAGVALVAGVLSLRASRGTADPAPGR
jgi:hypothetical protein